MIFGIDLGTTNSLLGYRDEYLTGLIPSIANLQTKQAGESLRFDFQALRSFKPDMSLGIEGIRPIAASDLVLRELCNVAKEAGYDVKEVVISVPADFNDNQRDATKKAAAKAGLDVKCLVNEPTAAAIQIAREKKALYLVFDLGGGTFDISVVDTRFGVYDVQDTDGCILGGDDFDTAIMKHFIKLGCIKSYKLGKEGFARLKAVATQAKIQMQKERKDIEVDLTGFGAGVVVFTEENYISLMKLTFADTITKSKLVINRSIYDGDTYKFLFVGGSTRCPYLQEWVCQELNAAQEEMDYDPDKVVAQGAARYAELLEKGVVDEYISDVTKQLSVELADGTCEVLIDKNSKIPIEQEEVFFNSTAGDKLKLNLYQGDSLFAESNKKIGTLVFDYGRPVAAYEGDVYVTISVARDGTIKFIAEELTGNRQEIVLQHDSGN